MFVIRLPNGNLRVPQTAVGNDGRIIGDAYVEIGPQDAEYPRLAEQAMTEDEAARRRAQWRDGDEALQREFQEFASRNSDYRWAEPGEDSDPVLRPARTTPDRADAGRGAARDAGLAAGTGRGTAAVPAARRYRIWWPSADGSPSPRSSARTSDSRNRRCPPGVRMLVMRPDAAQRVTVFGSTRKSAATSPGVSNRSLFPSKLVPSQLCPAGSRT